jgi:hypothetical protein
VKNASSAMLRRVVLVRTDVSKEIIASINRMTRIGELGTTLAVTSSCEEIGVLHSHCREILESYILNADHTGIFSCRVAEISKIRSPFRQSSGSFSLAPSC